MGTVVAVLTALAGIVSALPFLLRAWQAHQLRRAQLARSKEIHDAVYSGDRDRLARLLERLRQAPRGLR